MSKEEFAIFAMALKTYFPKDNLIPSKEAMELWYRQLADLPYNLAEVFLQKWVATEKWPPSIAEIRSNCTKIAGEEIPDWGEGWKEVVKYIGLYGYGEKDIPQSAMRTRSEKSQACSKRRNG